MKKSPRAIDRRLFFCPEEARHLLETARARRGRLGQRNYVLLALAVNTGLRSGEIVTLRCSALEERHGVFLLSVRGSRGHHRVREIVLTDAMAKLLMEWIEDVRRGGPFDSYLFFRREWSGVRRPLSRRAIEELFKRALERARLSTHYSFRALRHTFATIYYRESRDILGLKDQLGLDRVASALPYSELDPIGQKENMSRFGELTGG